MREAQGWFVAHGGTSLFRRALRPTDGARGVVAVVHGFGDHSGRYGPLATALVGAGYAVHAFDMRGHGRSPGIRGHVDSWSEYRADLHAFLGTVVREEPGLPVFLFGHSYGGLVCLEYALNEPGRLSGVIASAPALDGPRGVRQWSLYLVARAVARAWPSFRRPVPLARDAISRDQGTLDEHDRDPLVHGLGSARWATESVAAIRWTLRNAHRWSLPLLVAHGTADRLVRPAASRRFVGRVRDADVELREYQGGYHESHNDIGRERFFIDIVEWLERVAGVPSSVRAIPRRADEEP